MYIFMKSLDTVGISSTALYNNYKHCVIKNQQNRVISLSSTIQRPYQYHKTI